MGYRAYKIWNWAEKKIRAILSPCSGGSGFIGNGFVDLMLLPLTYPLSLPFLAISTVAKKYFKIEKRVIIPSSDFTQVLMLESHFGELFFPHLSYIPEAIQIDEAEVFWIQNGWHRDAYVSYHLMMRGIMPAAIDFNDDIKSNIFLSNIFDTSYSLKWKNLQDLVDGAPAFLKRDLRDLFSKRERFESWKGIKFDIKQKCYYETVVDEQNIYGGL